MSSMMPALWRGVKGRLWIMRALNCAPTAHRTYTAGAIAVVRPPLPGKIPTSQCLTVPIYPSVAAGCLPRGARSKHETRGSAGEEAVVPDPDGGERDVTEEDLEKTQEGSAGEEAVVSDPDGGERDVTEEEFEKKLLEAMAQEIRSFEKAAESVCAWAKKHVVHHGLCPFAEPALKTGNVRVMVMRGPDAHCPRMMAHRIYQEGLLIATTGKEEVSTTLIALPLLHPEDFQQWHIFTEALEDMLERDPRNTSESVVVASYHPLFEFDGIPSEGAAIHFEKRSPVPVIQLVRTEMVDKAVDEGFVVEELLNRNEKTLNDCGIDSVSGNFAGIEPWEGSVTDWDENGQTQMHLGIMAYRIRPGLHWGR